MRKTIISKEREQVQRELAEWFKESPLEMKKVGDICGITVTTFRSIIKGKQKIKGGEPEFYAANDSDLWEILAFLSTYGLKLNGKTFAYKPEKDKINVFQDSKLTGTYSHIDELCEFIVK